MDIAELQRVVAELTKKNDDLKAHVATAEAATRAATGRAQIRYTEKLLANRDAERCKTAFELEKKERLDDQLKAMRCFYGLQQTIEALRQEKEFLVTNSAPQLSQDGSTHKLTDVQNIRDENMRLKMLAASITEENKQLAATITQLQNDLAATQVNSAVAGPDTVARAEIQQIQATLEQDRLAFTTHKQQMRTAWVNETASLNKQLANCRQEEEQKRVSLQNQLRTQAEEVQWYKLQLQQALERAQQGSAHSHLGVHGGIPLTPEQKNEQVESIQKRRRLNLASGSSVTITTPKSHTSSNLTKESLQRDRIGCQAEAIGQEPNGSGAPSTPSHQLQQQRGPSESPLQRKLADQIMNRKQSSQGLNQEQQMPQQQKVAQQQQSAQQQRTRQRQLVSQQQQKAQQQGKIPLELYPLSQHKPIARTNTMINKGMSQDQAQATLQNRGLGLRMSGRENDGSSQQLRVDRVLVFDDTPRRSSEKVQSNTEVAELQSTPSNNQQPVLDYAPFQFRASKTAGQRRLQPALHSAQETLGLQLGYKRNQASTLSPALRTNQQMIRPYSEQHETQTLTSQPTHQPTFHNKFQSMSFANNVSTQENRGKPALTLMFSHQDDDWISEGPYDQNTTLTTDRSSVPKDIANNPGDKNRNSTPSVTQSAHRTPTPNASSPIACVHCYSNWWEQSCEGQPCTNCVESGIDCMRPMCANFSDCTRGLRCKLVHANNTLYQNPAFLKTLYRPGSMPRRSGKKSDAEIAPSVLGKLRAA